MYSNSTTWCIKTSKNNWNYIKVQVACYTVALVLPHFFVFVIITPSPFCLYIVITVTLEPVFEWQSTRFNPQANSLGLVTQCIYLYPKDNWGNFKDGWWLSASFCFKTFFVKNTKISYPKLGSLLVVLPLLRDRIFCSIKTHPKVNKMLTQLKAVFWTLSLKMWLLWPGFIVKYILSVQVVSRGRAGKNLRQNLSFNLEISHLHWYWSLLLVMCLNTEGFAMVAIAARLYKPCDLDALTRWFINACLLTLYMFAKLQRNHFL